MVRRVKPCLGTIYDKEANSEGPTRGEQKTKLPSMARTGALQEQDGPSGSPRVGLQGRKLISLRSQTWTRESDCSRRPDGCRILFHSCMSCKENNWRENPKTLCPRLEDWRVSRLLLWGGMKYPADTSTGQTRQEKKDRRNYKFQANLLQPKDLWICRQGHSASESNHRIWGWRQRQELRGEVLYEKGKNK